MQNLLTLSIILSLSLAILYRHLKMIYLGIGEISTTDQVTLDYLISQGYRVSRMKGGKYFLTRSFNIGQFVMLNPPALPKKGSRIFTIRCKESDGRWKIERENSGQIIVVSEGYLRPAR
jgi:hypothetical protein